MQQTGSNVRAVGVADGVDLLLIKVVACGGIRNKVG
jgi:hypothetical protein